VAEPVMVLAFLFTGILLTAEFSRRRKETNLILERRDKEYV